MSHLLEYQQKILADVLRSEGLWVLGKGLGLATIFKSVCEAYMKVIHHYCPSLTSQSEKLIVVLNVDPDSLNHLPGLHLTQELYTAEIPSKKRYLLSFLPLTYLKTREIHERRTPFCN